MMRWGGPSVVDCGEGLAVVATFLPLHQNGKTRVVVATLTETAKKVVKVLPLLDDTLDLYEHTYARAIKIRQD
jgi:hypothetical protein